jgi:L-iditol 2-dehydrogenase
LFASRHIRTYSKLCLTLHADRKWIAKPGAKVVMIGMGNPVQTLPISSAAVREVDLIGVFRYAGVYREALAIIAANPHLLKMVTRRFRGLSEINQAFDAASTPNDENGAMMLKVLIDVDEA